MSLLSRSGLDACQHLTGAAADIAAARSNLPALLEQLLGCVAERSERIAIARLDHVLSP
jgi:hypothetical protein